MVELRRRHLALYGHRLRFFIGGPRHLAAPIIPIGSRLHKAGQDTWRNGLHNPSRRVFRHVEIRLPRRRSIVEEREEQFTREVLGSHEAAFHTVMAYGKRYDKLLNTEAKRNLRVPALAVSNGESTLQFRQRHLVETAHARLFIVTHRLLKER